MGEQEDGVLYSAADRFQKPLLFLEVAPRSHRATARLNTTLETTGSLRKYNFSLSPMLERFSHSGLSPATARAMAHVHLVHGSCDSFHFPREGGAGQ